MNYSEQLKHPEWKRKRFEIIHRDGATCCMCGYVGNKLNVHHNGYLPNKMAWEYPNEMLFTLCYDCHKKVHRSLYFERKMENTQIGKIIENHFKFN